jgi:hypothetical protein
MNGAQANYLFSLKAYLTLQPYYIFISVFVGSLIIFTLSIRTFENGLQSDTDNYDVTISLWLVV